MQQTMLEKAIIVLKEKGINLKRKDNLWVATVTGPEEGIVAVKSIFSVIIDPQTLLLLSGGSTPKPLYEQLAQEATINPGAVAEVDERYGEQMHKTSNQRMIQETGLPIYLVKKGIPYSTILQKGLSLTQTADAYHHAIEDLLTKYPRSIAILGIGDDGHTSGIAPNRPDFINPIFGKQNRLVSSFHDASGYFGQRVTTTFAALGKVGMLIPMVFGEKKQEALQKMFSKGPLEEVPARFYTQPSIAPKTLLITDQKI